MKGNDRVGILSIRFGPVIWALSGISGLAAGGALTQVLKPQFEIGENPVIPIYLLIPFALLLASIALMPFISQRAWHRHYPDFSFALGGLVAGYYLTGFSYASASHASHGRGELLHALQEFYSFIALVGGLYVVSGGILVKSTGRARPLTNTLLLAAGAVLANLVGTTGASVLLIRPFMRLNEGRLKPLHIVMFIFIVSNCGGCLTPIGDPPLYLGFLKGIPFLWTMEHLWTDWALTVAILLAMFFAIDTYLERSNREREVPAEHVPVRIGIEGGTGLFCLALMIVGVFIDPALEVFAGIHGLPAGATFQLLVAVTAYTKAPRQLLSANEFSFEPVKEVGLLFVGIFVTMVPALAYLSSQGPKLGLSSSTTYYWASGGLSALLDNAPTYLNFLQIAIAPEEVSRSTLRAYIATDDGLRHVQAISTGAVFFGAMTYIGNGPNFMVRSIAQAAGVRMPSFFGYIGWALLILLPVLAIHWVVMIR